MHEETGALSNERAVPDHMNCVRKYDTTSNVSIEYRDVSICYYIDENACYN